MFLLNSSIFTICVSMQLDVMSLREVNKVNETLRWDVYDQVCM